MQNSKFSKDKKALLGSIFYILIPKMFCLTAIAGDKQADGHMEGQFDAKFMYSSDIQLNLQMLKDM